MFIYLGMDIRKQFGLKVRQFRIEKGMSQEALALAANLDRTYIPGIEKGSRNVSIVVVEKISIALNVPIIKFFET